MLLSAAERDDLMITRDHIQMVFGGSSSDQRDPDSGEIYRENFPGLIPELEKGLPYILSIIHRTPVSDMADRVAAIIAREQRISRTDLARRVSRFMHSDDIDRTLRILIDRGDVISEMVPGKRGKPAMW